MSYPALQLVNVPVADVRRTCEIVGAFVPQGGFLSVMVAHDVKCPCANEMGALKAMDKCTCAQVDLTFEYLGTRDDV